MAGWPAAATVAVSDRMPGPDRKDIRRVRVRVRVRTMHDAYDVPRCETLGFSFTVFSVAGPREGNELPADLRLISETSTFKRTLNTRLFALTNT